MAHRDKTFEVVDGDIVDVNRSTDYHGDLIQIDQSYPHSQDDGLGFDSLEDIAKVLTVLYCGVAVCE